MELKPGTFLQGNKYRIEKSLGYGGFAITYLAEQVLASRMVCIKEFFPKTYYNRNDDKLHVSLGTQCNREMMDAYKKKFLTEARTIANLDHPNIIHILDIFEENDTVYYVMDYINGGTLLDTIRAKGPIAEQTAVAMICSIANALAYIHNRKIAHLDIKPSNIMVRKSDNRAILIDFGLSKQYDIDGHQLSSTPVGISHGFAPIEQYQMGGVSDFSSKPDIYSLGATLYFILSGAVPPPAASLLNSGLPDIPGVSQRTMAVIRKAMSVSMNGRYDSAEEMVEALSGCYLPDSGAAAGGVNVTARAGRPDDADATDVITDPPFVNLNVDVAPTEPMKPEDAPVVSVDEVDEGSDTQTDTLIEISEEPEVKSEYKSVVKQPSNNSKTGVGVAIVLIILCVVGVAAYFFLAKDEQPVDPDNEAMTEVVDDDPTAINRIDDEEWERMRANGEIAVGDATEEVDVTADDADDVTEVVADEEVVDDDDANSITDVAVAQPVFTLTSSSSVSVAGSLTHGSIRYTLENPIEGVAVSVQNKPDWIYVSYGDGVVNYSVYANNTSRSRSATLTVCYGDQSFNVSFTQEPGDSTPNVIPDTPSRSRYSTSGGSTERNSY